MFNTDIYKGVVEFEDPASKPIIKDLALSAEAEADPSSVISHVAVAQNADDAFAFEVSFGDAAAITASGQWNYVAFNVNASFEDVDHPGNKIEAKVIPMVINRKAYTLKLQSGAVLLPGTALTTTTTNDIAKNLIAIKSCDKMFTDIPAFAYADYEAATMTTTVAPASESITAAFDPATKIYTVTIADAATAGKYALTSVLSIAGREITITKEVEVLYPIYTINVKSNNNFTAALPAPFAALADNTLTTVWKSVSNKATEVVKLEDIVDIATLTHNRIGAIYRFENDLELTTPITTEYTFTGDKWADMSNLTDRTNDQSATLFVKLSTGQVIPVEVCTAGAVGKTPAIVFGDKSNELNMAVYNAKAKEVAITTGGTISFVYTINRPNAELNWTIKANDFAGVDMLTDDSKRIDGKPVYSIDRLTDAISAIDAETGELTFSKVWSPRANETYTITVKVKDILGNEVVKTQKITVTDR